MSMFTVFDATRIADRLAGDLDDTDESRWILAGSLAADRPPRPAVVPVPFSWWSMARNPSALLLSGMVTAAMLRDAVRTTLG